MDIMDRRSGNSAVSGHGLSRRAEDRRAGAPAPVAKPSDGERHASVLHSVQGMQARLLQLETQNQELLRMQLASEAARAHYLDLYDRAPVGYCNLSEIGLIRDANLEAARLLGAVRKNLLGQRISHFVLPAQRDGFQLYLKRLLDTRVSQTCELQLIQQDGPSLWMHVSGVAGQDADGQLVLRLVLHNISAARAVLDGLRASEAGYRAMVEWAPEAICMQRAGKIIFANTAALALFGATDVHQLLGQPMLDRLHPDYRAAALARMKQMTQAHQPTPIFQEVVLRLDASAVPVQVQSLTTVYEGAPAIQVSMRALPPDKT